MGAACRRRSLIFVRAHVLTPPRILFFCFFLGAASLDTVEDLLLYTPPGLTNDVPSARFKRQQITKGVSSGGYDRLVNLTPTEIAEAYDQAAAHIFESKIAYGTALDLLQEENWLSLGDPTLDAALGGKGIMTRAITEIAGERLVVLCYCIMP